MPVSTRAPQNLPTLRILWFAFITTHLMFAGLMLSGILISDPSAPSPEGPELLPLILSAFAVSNVFLAHGLRYMMYFKAKAQLPLAKRLPRYASATMVAFALAESGTIFGFVIAFITRVPYYIVPFAALGLLCHLTLMPKQAHLDD